jgi:NTP pyrophosphatase (non-canonical NTP hydrolase)
MKNKMELEKMNIEETKKQIAELIRKRNRQKGIKESPELSLMHLIEEVGELSSGIIDEKMKREKLSKKFIGHQIIDCLVDLMLLSDQFEINLNEEIKKWEKNDN